MPSAGYTSVNLGRFFTNQNSDNYWWFVYTVGYYETIKPIRENDCLTINLSRQIIM